MLHTEHEFIQESVVVSVYTTNVYICYFLREQLYDCMELNAHLLISQLILEYMHENLVYLVSLYTCNPKSE